MRFIKFYIALLLIFIASTVFAQTPAEQELNALLSSFSSMNANFEQTAIIKKGASKTSFGTMALQRPGKFRWEITSPSHQLIVADGKYLWVYDVDLEQATRQSLTKDKHSPAILLSGSTSALEQRFTILNAKQYKDKKLFELKPKNDKDMIGHIELEFTAQKLTKMAVLDNLGQKTTFNFTHVNVNPSLSPMLFQFHPPKGVDVIKN